MEEYIGNLWHQAVTRWADTAHHPHAVRLDDMQKPIGILFRAAGGLGTLRFMAASEQTIGGHRNWLQRMAGGGIRAALPVLEADVLALPPVLAVFDQTDLNRDLYLWLSLLAACYQNTGQWAADNVAATRQALIQFSGFAPRYHRLCEAQLVLRPALSQLSGKAAEAEREVQHALRNPSTDFFHSLPNPLSPKDVAPVWLWVVGVSNNPLSLPRSAPKTAEPASQRTAQPADMKRRKAKKQAYEKPRAPMILPFRAESLLTWDEKIQTNRATDDEEDENAITAADDMETLTIAEEGETLAARVRFDLDLPSSSADDTVLDEGRYFPEWDYRSSQLVAAHCCVQELMATPRTEFVPSPHLRYIARQLRRKLEVLRNAPRCLRGQESGDDIDMDAWVHFQSDCLGGQVSHSDTPPVYVRNVRGERSLSTLLLADLSQSTDAYANNDARIIDLIRDALYVFGEALSAVGDPFAIWGFSSVRRQNVRMQHIKSFEDRWNPTVQHRVGAIRPGYYTRMGAAIRHATAQLQQRSERKRLLMLLTDGKPNDLDIYEGRYGLEDTRHAIHEARLAGLTPFCVTIDATAHGYLPQLFGKQGYAMMRHPQELVHQLTKAWGTLAR